MTITHLLWIDLETTGIDLHHDRILEVGAILTDTNLDVIDEMDLILDPGAEGYERLAANPYVTEMHRANGLLDAVAAGNVTGTLLSTDDAKDHLMSWVLSAGAAKGEIAICGSGVAKFDFQLLARDLPALIDYCAYFVPYDSGILRRSYEMATGKVLTAINESKTHRGIDDIRCHLAEAMAFRNAFRTLNALLGDVYPEIDFSAADFDVTAAAHRIQNP